MTLGVLWDYFEGTLRVVLVHYDGSWGLLRWYLRVLRVLPSLFEITLVSLWEYSGITLKVLWGPLSG